MTSTGLSVETGFFGRGYAKVNMAARLPRGAGKNPSET